LPSQRGRHETLAPVAAGRNPIGLSTIAPVEPHVTAGTVRALAVTGKTRTEILPTYRP
jgi:tripartite-type tricarboxylate transporter receptor subunit TctC